MHDIETPIADRTIRVMEKAVTAQSRSGKKETCFLCWDNNVLLLI